MIAVLSVSVAFGVLRGGLREGVTLLALGGGAGLIAGLGTPLSSLFEGNLAMVTLILCLLFALGFVVVTSACEYVLRGAVGPRPRPADRFAGGAFGLLRGWFLCGLTFLTVSYYFDGVPLPDMVADAASRGFAGGAARILERAGIDGQERQMGAGEPLEPL